LDGLRKKGACSWPNPQDVDLFDAEWKQQGRQEGDTQILRRQLRRRFGPKLPAWVDTRLANADTDQLVA
jgi:hypothetical protein